MNRPAVINKAQALRYPARTGDVYVGRPSPWGNPFEISRYASRAQVVEAYAAWIAERPELVAQLRALNPRRLVCWCAPRACHADVLADLLEALP